VSDPNLDTSTRACPACKKPLEEGIRFCPHCGKALTDTSVTQADSTPTGGRHPTSRELDLPVVIGNRYKLVQSLGGGGMAKVYRATDLTLEREVAVKLINPDLRAEPEFDARFQREAKIASSLADPHIVVVHDFGLDAEHGPYLVMEYLQGQSLRERIQSSGPLPLKAGLQLCAQLMLALIHAHSKGIVHRDIKPDNIFLLNVSGVKLHVRVLDFGIARIYRRDDPTKAETITHAGAVLGTPRYMSPEQLAGQPVDARSDLYSAALVIHEALTGQLPYVGGKKLMELCPDATQALQDLLDQCLKPNPAERPPTAVEVYLRLQELGKASGILLLPPGAMDRLVAARKANEPTIAYTPAPDTAGTTRRRVLIGTAVVLALLGVAALAKWLLFSGPRGGPESLLGVQIGESLDSVGDKLRIHRSESGNNPWKRKHTRTLLGNVLRPEDLGLKNETELAEVQTRWTPDEKVCVLFFQDKVIAVVATGHDARTSRGVKVGDYASAVYEKYPNAEEHGINLPGGRHVETPRDPTAGVGFEIERGRITSIALFLPVKKQ
jgi:tRNA A-37 threonylcarbamoyl transferase component Bud32